MALIPNTCCCGAPVIGDIPCACCPGSSGTGSRVGGVSTTLYATILPEPPPPIQPEINCECADGYFPIVFELDSPDPATACDGVWIGEGTWGCDGENVIKISLRCVGGGLSGTGTPQPPIWKLLTLSDTLCLEQDLGGIGELSLTCDPLHIRFQKSAQCCNFTGANFWVDITE